MVFFRNTIRVISFSGRAFNYIVTLGGSEELKGAKANYNKEHATYTELFDRISGLKRIMDNTLQSIGENVNSAQSSLAICHGLLSSKHLSIEQKSVNFSTVKKTAMFNNSFNSAMETGFGTVVGGVIAVGAWAVVSLIGSASTGTAISTLSGVAAYNATLAWFGGGALAAGGAGMSGGMIVLGGIVAAPMIFFATKGTYAKAEKTKRESDKLKDEILKLADVETQAEDQLKSMVNYHEIIKILSSTYTNKVQELIKMLYPFGAYSKVKQNFLRLFGRPYFTKNQESILEELRVLTNRFLNEFETHPLD